VRRVAPVGIALIVRRVAPVGIALIVRRVARVGIALIVKGYPVRGLRSLQIGGAFGPIDTALTM
jgi:hypothetical protein